MSAHFEASNLPGFARWMRLQLKKSRGTRLKFFDYMHDRGGAVRLLAIDQPPAEWKSSLRTLSTSSGTRANGDRDDSPALRAGCKENDYATEIMLQWFITEQVEEKRTRHRSLTRSS